MPAPKGFRPPAAGKGRQKGVPNKATTAIKDMIIQALSKAGGVDYLERQAAENPGPFLTLIGKVLPLQITGDPAAPLYVVSGVPRKPEDADD